MDSLETNVILIVDDTPSNLEVLSEALTVAGFEVAVATNGESALKQAEYDPPELILLDVMMPGIDGFETCRRLKQNQITKDIPVIFMTALNDSQDKVIGLSLGAVDYITKPFQQAEVLARIQVHVKLQSLSKKLEQQNIRLKEEVKQRIEAETALHQLNQNLEQQVTQRTWELSQALHDLQQAQLQLVQSEKLSTLGQLVAGIAHEINNPVGFIHGNIQHANQYIQDLLKLVQLYQNHFAQIPSEIEDKQKEIDLEFLIEDLPKILGSMEVGTERIREIVLSLRNFSRHDEAEFKVVNIHEGIDSTLALLQHRLSPKNSTTRINVIKEYGNLPKVECYAGKINQVFMNILANAIDALEDVLSSEGYSSSPTIRIITEIVTADRVAIRIIDNASGIPEKVKKRIFEPFFTTKPAGKGTGLGMSISHQIITEKHNGLLMCLSAPGKGTEFVIEIPIKVQSFSQNQWIQSQNLKAVSQVLV
ncbi:MAG: response regulator [Rivularia sp. (in: Bacteria)]|nr:response regulator [Rivularia sp. MS3]